jgi:ADP-ribosylglycohydrolase
MTGAIIGDIVGSVYESSNVKPSDFNLFDKGCSITDDSVLTIAIARAITECIHNKDIINSRKYYIKYLQLFGRRYPYAGYGQGFFNWLFSDDPKPYYSFGNGSAMRVSPIGYAFDDLDATLKEAEKSAEVTHNHPDGINGAKAIAAAVYLARNGGSKHKIKNYIESEIHYPLDFDLEDLHRNYQFEIKCSRSVPQAIFAFLESRDFEDAIRKAIYIGGDSDTIACMAGAVAEAYYKNIPEDIYKKISFYLDEDQKNVIKQFKKQFNIKY